MYIDCDSLIQEQLTPEECKAVHGAESKFSVTERDMLVMLALFEKYNIYRILEIGTNEGATAAFLLKMRPNIMQWVGVDLIRAPDYIGRRCTDERYHLFRTDGTVKHAEQLIGPLGKFACIFIDADHSFESVKRDTEYSEKFLASGGIMIWHDYDVLHRYKKTPFGVKKYIDDLKGDIYLSGDRDRNSFKCCSLAWRFQK